MALRIDERATDFEQIDRYDGGTGWIAHPSEEMQRASHAIVRDGSVWLVDPVEAAGIDDVIESFGEVVGVTVLFDRHTRDASSFATRYDVPVYVPDFIDGVEAKIDAPIVRFGAELTDTGIEVIVLKNNRFWQEAALFVPPNGEERGGEIGEKSTGGEGIERESEGLSRSERQGDSGVGGDADTYHDNDHDTNEDHDGHDPDQDTDQGNADSKTNVDSTGSDVDRRGGDRVGTLIVPESLGTASYFRSGSEPLGVHPLRRPFPPQELLAVSPERILVGHGPGVHTDAPWALTDAITNARRRLPKAYFDAVRSFAPI